MKRLTKMAAGLALAIGAMLPGESHAQEQPQNDGNAWIKLCPTPQENAPTLCLTTQEVRTNQGQFLASMTIRETEGEQRRSMLIAVPVGMVLNPGVGLQIDGGEPTSVPYSICFPNACYAERTIDTAFIDRLKRGGELQMITFNQQGKQVRFPLTLIGFTAAYDGDGIDPQALQQKQADLQRQLDQRAQEARDRLVAEQRRAIEGTTQ